MISQNEACFSYGKTLASIMGQDQVLYNRVLQALLSSSISTAEQILRAAILGKSYDIRLLEYFPYRLLGISEADYHSLIKCTIDDIWKAFREQQQKVRDELRQKDFYNHRFTVMVARNSALYAPVPQCMEGDLAGQMAFAQKDADQNKRTVLIQFYPHMLGEYALIFPAVRRNIVSSILVPPSPLALEAARILKIPLESIRLFQTNTLSVANAITGQLHAFLKEPKNEI